MRIVRCGVYAVDLCVAALHLSVFLCVQWGVHCLSTLKAEKHYRGINGTFGDGMARRWLIVLLAASARVADGARIEDCGARAVIFCASKRRNAGKPATLHDLAKGVMCA